MVLNFSAKDQNIAIPIGQLTSIVLVKKPKGIFKEVSVWHLQFYTAQGLVTYLEYTDKDIALLRYNKITNDLEAYYDNTRTCSETESQNPA